MIRRLDPERLTNILTAFYGPAKPDRRGNIFRRVFRFLFPRDED
jgi:hypothetical protein